MYCIPKCVVVKRCAPEEIRQARCRPIYVAILVIIPIVSLSSNLAWQFLYVCGRTICFNIQNWLYTLQPNTLTSENNDCCKETETKDCVCPLRKTKPCCIAKQWVSVCVCVCDNESVYLVLSCIASVGTTINAMCDLHSVSILTMCLQIVTVQTQWSKVVLYTCRLYSNMCLL